MESNTAMRANKEHVTTYPVNVVIFHSKPLCLFSGYIVFISVPWIEADNIKVRFDIIIV